MSDFIEWYLIVPALLAGTIILLTHIPLGSEVLKRGIIFIDLALAQLAALGIVIASTLYSHFHPFHIELIALMGALTGAIGIALLERYYPNNIEALIGLIFVLASTASMILISFSANGDKLLHQLLLGQILWVTTEQLIPIGVISLLTLLIWSFYPKPYPNYLFYILFSIAVTLSVQLVGLYLVFASLIIPALTVRSYPFRRPFLNHLFPFLIGFFGYLTGIILSLVFDLPTGAIIVWAMTLLALISYLFRSVMIKKDHRRQS
ncbi:MAG TPA: zinc/manganese transporter permease [Gammaproteobacteria bacterium]|nr:zinc/manganese transporter permease [Gammaproteobacteria bacterium]